MLPFPSLSHGQPLAEIGVSQTQIIVVTIMIFAASLAYIIWLIKRKL
jgi:hypothetical protein